MPGYTKGPCSSDHSVLMRLLPSQVSSVGQIEGTPNCYLAHEIHSGCYAISVEQIADSNGVDLWVYQEWNARNHVGEGLRVIGQACRGLTTAQRVVPNARSWNSNLFQSAYLPGGNSAEPRWTTVIKGSAAVV